MATVADLEIRLNEVVSTMPIRMRRYAENLLQIGEDRAFKTQREAYIASGYKDKANSNNSSKIASDPRVQEYRELQKQIATRRAMEALEYDETQWLWDTVAGMQMALGRQKMKVSPEQRSLNRETGELETSFDEREIIHTDLKSAARYSEILGKRLGLLTEKKLIGEDPENPLKSLKEFNDILNGIAEQAQNAGPVRNE